LHISENPKTLQTVLQTSGYRGQAPLAAFSCVCAGHSRTGADMGNRTNVHFDLQNTSVLNQTAFIQSTDMRDMFHSKLHALSEMSSEM
jgi:hypothetical protein